ncbi:MAG: SAM-dependent methyltransferase, partial [uncultured Sphingomonas sp.]
ERPPHPGCGALGRLGPGRQRQWPQARAIWPGTGDPARTAGDVVASRVRLAGRCRVLARQRRGGRRPLGPAPAGATDLAAGPRSRPLPRLVDAIPPPRLLPRHGTAMGLDARPGGWRGDHEPVRLHRRRHPAAERSRRAHGPCGCFQEERGGRPGQRRPVRSGRPAAPLARRGRRQIHRARGAARPALRRHPARSAQVRPRPDGRGVAAGGASRALAGRLPPLARREQPLPGANGLRRAHVGAGDWRAGAADPRRSRRHGGMRRDGGARGTSRPAAADRHLRAVEPL